MIVNTALNSVYNLSEIRTNMIVENEGPVFFTFTKGKDENNKKIEDVHIVREKNSPQ